MSADESLKIKERRKKAVEAAPMTKSMFVSDMRGRVRDLLDGSEDRMPGINRRGFLGLPGGFFVLNRPCQYQDCMLQNQKIN